MKKYLIIFLILAAAAQPISLPNLAEYWLDGYDFHDFGRLAENYGLVHYANWELTSMHVGQKIKEAGKVVTTKVFYKYINGYYFAEKSITRTVVSTEFEITQSRAASSRQPPDPNTIASDLSEAEEEMALNPAAITIEDIPAGLDPNDIQLYNMVKGLGI